MSMRQIGDYYARKIRLERVDSSYINNFSSYIFKYGASMIRLLSTVIAIQIAFIVFIVDMYEDEITMLESKILDGSKYTDSEQRFQNTMQVLHLQNERVNELEAANQALIEVCRPSAFNEVLKHTPLPKLVKDCR